MFLCIAAAHILEMWIRQGGKHRVLGIVLAAVLGLQSIAAHPDYLTYVPFPYQRWKEYLVATADLDFGQDRKRLAQLTAALGLERITVCSAVPVAPFFAEYSTTSLVETCPNNPVSGWFAVTLTAQMEQPEVLAWLKSFEPAYTVGASTRVFKLP